MGDILRSLNAERKTIFCLILAARFENAFVTK